MLFALVGLAAGLSVQLTGSTASDDVRITVEIRDQLLPEALATIGELAGSSIELIGSVDDRRVSVSLRATTFGESLERILSPSSYTIVWRTDDGLAIHVLDDEGDPSGAGSTLLEPSEEPFDSPISMFPNSEEVLPPSHPGDHGVTAADIEYLSSFDTPWGPGEEEQLPPASPSEAGMTAEDLEFLSGLQQEKNLAEIELLPPEDGHEFGLTLAESEAMASGGSGLLLDEEEILPPDELGGSGLTLQQLEPMKQPETVQQSLTDLIPPD